MLEGIALDREKPLHRHRRARSFGAAPAASTLSRLVSIWAVRLGPGHLVALSAAVMALAAGITWGWVKGEARWLISWDAGVLTYTIPAFRLKLSLSFSLEEFPVCNEAHVPVNRAVYGPA